MNTCGTCSVCCRAMGVIEIGKAPGAWCSHCTKPGCGIYTARPSSCVEFQCEWLARGLAPDLRPDVSHVLMVQGDDGCIVAKVDKRHPDAHKAAGVGAFMRDAVASGIVVFVILGDNDDLREVQYSSKALNSAGKSGWLNVLRRIAS